MVFVSRSESSNDRFDYLHFIIGNSVTSRCPGKFRGNVWTTTMSAAWHLAFRRPVAKTAFFENPGSPFYGRVRAAFLLS